MSRPRQVATNLAVSLALDGASVGLLDADITGPNIPQMMGIEGAPSATPEGRKEHRSAASTGSAA